MASCARPGKAIIYNFWHLGTWTQPWASEWLDVKNYKWQLNPVWHRMLYSIVCSLSDMACLLVHFGAVVIATVGVKGLNMKLIIQDTRPFPLTSYLIELHVCSVKIIIIIGWQPTKNVSLFVLPLPIATHSQIHSKDAVWSFLFSGYY